MAHKKKTSLGILGALIILFLIILYTPLFEGTRIYAYAVRSATRIRFFFSSAPDDKLVKLNIAFDPQDHSLSCEVATLKMALAYRGIVITEAELNQRIGVDNTPKTKENGQLIWGDPYKAFVGNINGSMFVDGYGVYPPAIAKAASDYRTVEAFENWDVVDIVRELNNDNPVIIWGYLGSGKKLSWKTPEGKTIPAVTYEHTFLVIGFKGDQLKPDGFYVIDPIYGKEYLSRGDFLKKWDALGRMGVVVR